MTAVARAPVPPSLGALQVADELAVAGARGSGAGDKVGRLRLVNIQRGITTIRLRTVAVR